jgi:hypothetical protein
VQEAFAKKLNGQATLSRPCVRQTQLSASGMKSGAGGRAWLRRLSDDASQILTLGRGRLLRPVG